ncbi:MAG: hypothetical protein WAZ94_15050 [Phycisphaerales bacterium]|nr:hypothetical protein [Chloroflexota bacterium]
MSTEKRSLAVFAVRKSKDGGAVWVRAGVAQVNRDQSINISLDVLPLDGRLHVRDALDARGEVWIERMAAGARIVLKRGSSRTVLHEDAAITEKQIASSYFTRAVNAAVDHGADLASIWLREEAP